MVSPLKPAQKQLLQEAFENFFQTGNEEKLAVAFKIFDRDGNNQLDVEEVKAAVSALVNLSEENIRMIFEQADKNKDGSIDATEFMEYLKEQRHRALD